MTDRELLEALLQEMKGIKENISTLKGDVSTLKGDVSTLKGDVSKLQIDMSNMQTELSDVKTLATKTKVLLENDVAKKINMLFEGHKLNAQKLDEIDDHIQDLQSSVLANEIVTKSTLREIMNLKKKA